MHRRSSFLVLACAAIACGDSGPTTTAAPLLAADPAQLDFGIQDVAASSAVLGVEITNSGTAPLASPIVSISGPAGADFAVDSSSSTCPGQTLAVDATCTLDVFFTPSAGGARTATLAMRGSGDDGASVALSGVGAGLVTVVRDGTGDGTVESSPVGISCGDECASNFAETVTLSATPDAASYLAGWSGACTGTGDCVIPPGSSQTATATFARYPETAFTATPLPQTNRAVAAWSFAGERAASFECSLDDAAFSACASPFAITEFGAGGSSTLRVRAIDGNGQADRTPAEGTVTHVTDPLLRYTFDGSAANGGALSGYDGSAGSVTYPAGKSGQSIKFDGASTTGVVIPGTAALLGGDHKWTIGFWFREDVAKYDTRLFDFRRLGGWHTYHGVSSANLTTCSPGGCFTFPGATGVWRHMLYRYNGVSATVGAPLEIWVDGVQVGTIANPENVPLTSDVLTDLELGRETGFTAGGLFYVDDLRVFNTIFNMDVQCERVIGGTWAGTSCTLP